MNRLAVVSVSIGMLLFSGGTHAEDVMVSWQGLPASTYIGVTQGAVAIPFCKVTSTTSTRPVFMWGPGSPR